MSTEADTATLYRRKRERYFRKMIEYEISRAEQLVTLAWRVGGVREGAYEPIPDKDFEKVFSKTLRLIAWQPERLHDERVRELALELEASTRDLRQRLIPRPWGKADDLDWGVYLEIQVRIETVGRSLFERMDKLNWPVIDE